MSVIRMLRGCYTALITPMNRDGSLDFEGLHDLLEYQSENEVAGIVAMGTTGESPTLDWKEHMSVVSKTNIFCGADLHVIAGTGANNTKESEEGTREAIDLGVKTILLVDPYYNGPSSLEIRREYYEPLAREFPGANFIPYIIPGRTGTMLLPEDLALLSEHCPNIIGVKEATGDFSNMRAIRRLCRENFPILSGDDEKTLAMMADPTILASGTISVVANILPWTMREMVNAQLDNDPETAKQLAAGLMPLMGIVTVKTEEDTPRGRVMCKARNPLATKTLMNILGMPAGPCRQPLGKMTMGGMVKVIEAARQVYATRPDFFEPIEEFFDVDVGERLHDKTNWEGLCYDSY
jgi:4-hydroxy-tetrahydrodipicolinate synthase